jgi:hypothetical protein
LTFAVFGCGGTQEPASLVIDLRTVGEVQWSMPVQYTAFDRAREPVLDLTLGHYGLPNKFRIPAGSYTLKVGWTGCPRTAVRLEDLDGDILVTASGGAVTLRGLGDGSTTRIGAGRTGLAQLERPGLFVASARRVTFIPMREVLRRLSR